MNAYAPGPAHEKTAVKKADMKMLPSCNSCSGVCFWNTASRNHEVRGIRIEVSLETTYYTSLLRRRRL